MNRHERRAQKSRDRQIGGSLRLTGAAKTSFQEQMQSDASVELFNRITELMPQWIKAHPDASPAWHWRAKDEKTILVGPLSEPEAQRLLAANDDAMAMLAWIDEQTGGKALTLHAQIALEYFRDMRDERVEQESPAFALLRSYAESKGQTTRMPDSPCPFCGLVLGGASAGDESVPTPGRATVCVGCGSISCFAEDLTLRRYTPEEWAAMPDDLRAHLDEVSALFRTAAMRQGKSIPRGDA